MQKRALGNLSPFYESVCQVFKKSSIYWHTTANFSPFSNLYKKFKFFSQKLKILTTNAFLRRRNKDAFCGKFRTVWLNKSFDLAIFTNRLKSRFIVEGDRKFGPIKINSDQPRKIHYFGKIWIWKNNVGAFSQILIRNRLMHSFFILSKICILWRNLRV